MRKMNRFLAYILALSLFAGIATGAGAQAPLIDINSATKQQLMTLPGIGDAYAAKIIAGRPYRNKIELKQNIIIPAATYDRIADKIMARQGKK